MRFPAPVDIASATRLIDAFPGVLTEAGRSLLACLGGNSPFLAEMALREPDTIQAILTHGPDAVCDLALGALTGVLPTLPRPRLAALLRTAKRRIALTAAVADIGGAWSLTQVTGALSDLAEGALRLVADHLLRTAHDRGELRLPHPSAPSRGAGFTVLAMGKLGARELNFSSDVDLILIYDPEAHAYNADALGAIFTRLTRDLVSLMQQRDAGGYVFRTDLRLRPDPASTPPAVSLSAALAYYEGAAQTWERAAMIKARPVAGDLALGRRFLAAIRPFVWRRHLDFAAIADIRAMKRRMDEHKGAALSPDGSPATRLLGHDLKLGQGGIREVEFCAQMLQLVWGGRNPGLRIPATLDALRALEASRHLPAEMVSVLIPAYNILRRAEHRLQMVDDHQTHRLPQTAEALERFARFMDFSGADAFASCLLVHLETVHTAFAGLLEQPAAPPDIGEAPQPALLAQPSDGDRPWRVWLEGHPIALRTERARALLRRLLPAIDAAVQNQAEPDVVWGRLDAFIYRLPQGVQLFSLLQHNPALLERLVDVLGAAPSLADHLAAVPAALEGLMSPQDIDPSPAVSLAAQLGDARAVDEALGIASRFVRGEEFRLAVAELDGRIDQDAAGDARTALAEAAIATLLPLVLRDHARRYGRLPGGGLVVVALGKAGSREMMAGSDLDLLLIYDHPVGATQSTGPSRLPPSQYFARAAQVIVAALTVPTRDGKLYDVDMRLRPSGNKGPVAVSLSAFTRYHQESAWTWERLALTRARVIAGPAPLRAKVTKAIKEAMAQGDPALIPTDTLAMRRRLLADLPPNGPWDVKRRRGGLMDVEFIAQALQLRLAASRPRLLSPITRIALRRLASAGALSSDEADQLILADATWRAIQGMLRITMGRSIPVALPEATEARVQTALNRLLGPSSATPLVQRIEAVAHGVSAAFLRHVGEI